MTTFWDKVEACKHEHKTDYFQSFGCGTPYCRGHEVRCADCGVYISDCGCRSNNGLSGWPYLRWRVIWQRTEQRQRQKELTA